MLAPREIPRADPVAVGDQGLDRGLQVRERAEPLKSAGQFAGAVQVLTSVVRYDVRARTSPSSAKRFSFKISTRRRVSCSPSIADPPESSLASESRH